MRRGTIGWPKGSEIFRFRASRLIGLITSLAMNGPHRLATCLVLLIMILGMVFISWGVYTVERRLIDSTGYSLVQAAGDAASKLELAIAERQDDVEAFAWSSIARGHDRQALTAYLHRLLWNYRAFQWFGVTDSHGTLIASTDPSIVGQDRAASVWFQEALKGHTVKLLDATPSREAHNRLAITFSSPIITATGEFHGVFATVVEMPYLVDLLDRTTRVLQDVAWLEESPIEYQILNRNGEVLADSHLHEEGHANLYAMGLPSARLVAVSGRGFVEEAHLRRHLQVITAYAQVNVPQPDSPLRWGILIRVDRESVLKPIRSFLKKLILIAMLVLLPTAALLLWLVRQIHSKWLLATQESARASNAESALSARVDALDALVKAANNLASAQNIESQLQHFLEVAKNITKARYASLGILDTERTHLLRCLAIGLDDTHVRAIGALPVEGGILSRLVQTEGTLKVENLGSLVSEDGLPPGLPLSSFLGISLRCHGELFGQLYLLEKTTADGHVTAFTDFDEQILVTLSLQAAVSIDNLRLLHDSKDRAMRDSLTGWLNHSSIQDALIRELARSERDKEPLTVLMADLDHFKRINDTYGHLVGDLVICEVTRRIGEVARRYDLLARVGGEEFLMVLPGCSEDTAAKFAERIRSAVGDVAICTPAGSLIVTISIGGTVWTPGNVPHAQRLWKTADHALYRVKERGRNGVAFLSVSQESLQGVV